MFLTISVLNLLIFLARSDLIIEQKFPESVKTCFDRAMTEPVDTDLAQRACIMEYYNEISKPQTLTKEDNEFFHRRISSRFGFEPPETGFRIRREIRTLSREERNRLFSVWGVMYKKGTIQRFGRLYGQAGKRVHKGAAFLPWHRVFILDFEEEMRRIDDRVFLPYWDYTIDNNISRPSDSIVWSECFFGNGEGFIQSGPFSNWYGGHGIQIKRDYARSGQRPPRLMNKYDIKRILQKCHFKDVTTGKAPYFTNINNIELLHDGVHDWVGGDMHELPFSAFDPVFYMHHAFVDYIWEEFRIHQLKNCKVSPETDWRPTDDLCQKDRVDHGPFDLMFGYSHLRNIDGAWNNWTRLFYNYVEQPTCPHCGNSEYLYCDKSDKGGTNEGICLTQTKRACNLNGTANKKENTKTDKLPNLSSNSIEIFQGMPGDGRSRDMSISDGAKVLKAEKEKGAAGQGDWEVIVNSSLLYRYSVKYSDQAQDNNEYKVTLQSCTDGCIGMTVIGVTFVALLFFIVVGFCFLKN